MRAMLEDGAARGIAGAGGGAAARPADRPLYYDKTVRRGVARGTARGAGRPATATGTRGGVSPRPQEPRRTGFETCPRPPLPTPGPHLKMPAAAPAHGATEQIRVARTNAAAAALSH